MIDEPFRTFIQHNLTSVDELMRRYAEYRYDVLTTYFNELQEKIRNRTPPDCAFESSYRMLDNGEQVFGWRLLLQIDENPINTLIGFGFTNKESLPLSGGWPLANGSCWTGIRFSSWQNLRHKIPAIGRALGIDTEKNDQPWLLWRFWTPLSAVSVEGLHTRLTGQDRFIGQEEIVDELFKWKDDLSKILDQTTS